MRVSRRAVALAALPAAAVADSVHLVDFPPYLSSLSTSCQTIYTDTIGGCSSTDFTSSFGCSAGCINALQAMEPVVIKACANQGIMGQNVIVAFLNNEGPSSLCGNAASVLGSDGDAATTSSSTAPANTATLISAPSSTMASTPALTATTTSTALDPLSTSTSSTDTTTASTEALSTPPSSIPETATSSGALITSSTTATHTAIGGSSTSASDPSETDNAHSGGGSPFDGSGTSGGNAISIPTAVSFLACSSWILFTAFW